MILGPPPSTNTWINSIKVQHVQVGLAVREHLGARELAELVWGYYHMRTHGVLVRCRPMNSREKAAASANCVAVDRALVMTTHAIVRVDLYVCRDVYLPVHIDSDTYISTYILIDKL